jgi:hypothetical protein
LGSRDLPSLSSDWGFLCFFEIGSRAIFVELFSRITDRIGKIGRKFGKIGKMGKMPEM